VIGMYLSLGDDDEEVGKEVIHRAINETVTPDLCSNLMRSVDLW
jgi:hypothetical protein